LRQKAEYQNLVSQAAVFIRYGDQQGADALLSMVPISMTPSSLEAASTYRSVADWHLLAGRWKQAARDYSCLVRAISKVDDSDNDTVSRNLLFASAATCFAGDISDYEQTRMLAIDRFAGTSHPVVAEQVLKVCLLLPANGQLLSRLTPLADILSRALDDRDSVISHNQHLEAWSCFSLALFHYRRGDDPSAANWALRCLASQRKNPARENSARIILAMIKDHAGQKDEAIALLKGVSGAVLEHSQPPMSYGDDDHGSWHAWLTARILLLEAEDLIRK
jgi:eukaryotic-like serine/threonine-protein kinase